MNTQFALEGDTVYVLEVNPRASRTVPFVSKAVGVPLAKIAARVMAGETLEQLGFTKEVIPRYTSHALCIGTCPRESSKGFSSSRS